MNHTEWNISTIEECLDRNAIRSTIKYQTKEYKTTGTYPIIDQGQEFISGWTDDPIGVVSDCLPLIVFGDHTRVFKFIDFPFVRGADGTQLLRPQSDIDPLFFFYACKAMDIPNRGYNRHFSILKKKKIALPPQDEQNKIAKSLSKIQNCIELQNSQLKEVLKLKLTVMHNLFTRGLQDEGQKETEFGLVPGSWNVDTIGNHYSITSGGTPSRNNPEYWNGGTIPWVKSTDINYSKIWATNERITKFGVANSAAKLLAPGAILMAMYGQGVTRGRVATLEIEATCNQACAAMYSLTKTVDQQFLFYFLTYHYENIRRLAHGGQQQNLNLEIIRNLPLAFPGNLTHQLEIVSILESIDQKIDIHKKKQSILEDLFKSLLHKLMTGEIRVNELDLSVFEKPVDATGTSV